MGTTIYADWILSMTDMEAGDSGVLNSWSLAAELSEPASLTLFGLGMLGLHGLHRRSNASGHKCEQG